MIVIIVTHTNWHFLSQASRYSWPFALPESLGEGKQRYDERQQGKVCRAGREAGAVG